MQTVERSYWRRTFENSIHSNANYWIGTYIDFAGAIVFLVVALYSLSGSPLSAVAASVIGWFGWGLTEYCVHRWVFHGIPTLCSRGHARHHEDDKALISTPLFVVAGVGVFLWPLFGLVLPSGLSGFLAFGWYSGYNYFAILHHLQHHRPKQLARIGHWRMLVLQHHLHHRDLRVNFGASTTIWDRVFGTYQPSSTRVRSRATRFENDEIVMDQARK